MNCSSLLTWAASTTPTEILESFKERERVVTESERWSLIPDVFFYRDDAGREAFSNSNRSLYCLQAIQKYFGKVFKIAVKPMYARQMSKVHQLSHIHDCSDMTVNGRFPTAQKGNNQVKQLRSALANIFPSTQQNAAERQLNIRRLGRHFDPANADLPEMESFTEFFQSKKKKFRKTKISWWTRSECVET